MGFAEEVAASRSGKTELPAQTAAATPAESPSGEMPGADFNHFAPPLDGEAHPETPVVETPVEAPAGAKVRIGGEYFDSAEDAIRYAEKLQLDAAQRDGYEQARKDLSKPKEEATPEKDPWEGIESEIFENPKAAAKRIYDMARAEAVKEIADKESARDQERTRQATVDKVWNDFYSSNQDLAQSREIVDFILQKNWDELGNLPSDKALELLSSKARTALRIEKQNTLPTKELSSNRVVATGASGAPTQVTAEKKASAVDFISQVKQLKRAPTKS